MNDSPSQKDCNDSSNDTTNKDPSSSQTLVVLASPGEKEITKISMQLLETLI